MGFDKNKADKLKAVLEALAEASGNKLITMDVEAASPEEALAKAAKRIKELVTDGPAESMGLTNGRRDEELTDDQRQKRDELTQMAQIMLAKHNDNPQLAIKEFMAEAHDAVHRVADLLGAIIAIDDQLTPSADELERDEATAKRNLRSYRDSVVEVASAFVTNVQESICHLHQAMEEHNIPGRLMSAAERADKVADVVQAKAAKAVTEDAEEGNSRLAELLKPVKMAGVKAGEA